MARKKAMIDEEWAVEAKNRVIKLLCTIHYKKRITISQAQKVMGDYGNADDLINTMLENKDLFKTTFSEENKNGQCYEFTHKGLVGLYSYFKIEADLKFGADLDEVRFMNFMRDESARIANENN